MLRRWRTIGNQGTRDCRGRRAEGPEIHVTAADNPSTALSRLIEFCYAYRDSIGLHSSHPSGEISCGPRTRMNFPIYIFRGAR